MIIVYRQNELDKALEDGCRKITLCAGIFTVRDASFVSFDRIGPVKVNVEYTMAESEMRGLKFINIYPTFKSAYGMTERESMQPVVACSAYVSSYGSYTSYGSGTGSYYHEYEFLHNTSWQTSITTSYVSSYTFVNSHIGSYKGNGAVCSANEKMKIFGYGINLI